MTEPRLQAVLFDLDDTLWPIAPVIERAELRWHAWLAAHAPRVAARFSIDELRRRRMALLEREPGLAIDLAALRRRGLGDAFAEVGEDPRHIDGAIRHFLAARNDVTLFDDVVPALTWLGPRVRLGVVTNGNADLDAIGLGHHFHATLASARFGSAKPDPAIFHAACAALRVAPERALYVGDDLRLDVAGAQRAGLRAAWINRGGGDAHLAAGIAPDAICASFSELLRWLQDELQQSDGGTAPPPR